MQNEQNEDARRAAYQILALLPQIVAKIQAHNFADSAGNGLHWYRKKVDGIEQAIWWVTTSKPTADQDPREFYITSDGILVDYEGNYRPLNPEDTTGFDTNTLQDILSGLQAILNPQPQNDSTAEEEPARRSWRKRLFGN